MAHHAFHFLQRGYVHKENSSPVDLEARKNRFNQASGRDKRSKFRFPSRKPFQNFIYQRFTQWLIEWRSKERQTFDVILRDPSVTPKWLKGFILLISSKEWLFVWLISSPDWSEKPWKEGLLPYALKHPVIPPVARHPPSKESNLLGVEKWVDFKTSSRVRFPYSG